MLRLRAKAISLVSGGLRRWLAGALFAAGAALVVWLAKPSLPRDARAPAAVDPPPPDPRLTYPTGYRNVRPDVEYVGSERCGGCHREIAASYHQHPMGQSLAPLDQIGSWSRLVPQPWKPFEALGLRYRVEARGDKIWHVESKCDGAGNEIVAQAEPVRYMIGSGTRGRSYLIERDGRLYQSPISWFAEESRWDLSPGFQEKQSHFNRAIIEACLFCHANRVNAVPQTLNRYQTPIFEGHAIGCERCHGPGDLHVKRQESGADYQALDDTIVQPGRLEPRLRDSVCEQCHLQGGQRVLVRGRSWFDYRPGLPLEAFVTTFVRTGADLHSVGQVEQLAESRCYQKSAGRLGCISCHDPHRVPAASEKVAFYRQRCLTCHAEGQGAVSCRLSASLRQARDNSCVACHMPRTGSASVVHVSITDHRIVRFDKAALHAAKSERGGLLLALFRGSGAASSAERDRDLGIALANVALLGQMTNLAEHALPRLVQATERDSRDREAWQAYANALTVLREPEKGLAVAQAVLAWAPNDETALNQAASLAMAAHKIDLAVEYGKRLVALNPSVASFQIDLSNAYALRGDWAEAEAAATAASALNPTQPGPRISLIQALLRRGERDRAQRELDLLERINAGNLEEVRRWFSR